MKDITITVIDREGERHKLIAPTDMAMNVMEVCKAHGLPVEGICGGMALCASCQCYVLSDHALDTKSDDEVAMLAEAFNVRGTSRLGCQIHITEALDRLEIELAPEED